MEVDHHDNVALAQAAADDCERVRSSRRRKLALHIDEESSDVSRWDRDYVSVSVKRYKTACSSCRCVCRGTGEKGWPNKLAFCRRHGLPGHLPGDPQLSEALSVVGAFVAHRKFAVSFISTGAQSY